MITGRQQGCTRTGGMPSFEFDDGFSPEVGWWAVAGLCALAAMFVLAVFGVVDMDDTKQRTPVEIPTTVYVVNDPVTWLP